MSGIQAVQKRPGMYIGSTDDGSGLHRMVFEVADNALKEALAGYCSRIEVTLAADGSVTVSDDGRGLPVDIHIREAASKAQVIMTRLHAGGMFVDRTEVPGVPDGVGLCVVNALSAWLELRVWREGCEHFMRFQNGYPAAALNVIGASNGRRGTEIAFLPSPKVFVGGKFDFSILERRFRELDNLNAHVTLVLADNRGAENKEVVLRL